MAARRRTVHDRTAGASRRPGSTAGEKIAAEIRSARRAAGLTQRELGSRLNRSPSWVSGVENGRRSLLVRDLQEVADALGLDPLELLARALQQSR